MPSRKKFTGRWGSTWVAPWHIVDRFFGYWLFMQNFNTGENTEQDVSSSHPERKPCDGRDGGGKDQVGPVASSWPLQLFCHTGAVFLRDMSQTQNGGKILQQCSCGCLTAVISEVDIFVWFLSFVCLQFACLYFPKKKLIRNRIVRELPKMRAFQYLLWYFSCMSLRIYLKHILLSVLEERLVWKRIKTCFCALLSLFVYNIFLLVEF